MRAYAARSTFSIVEGGGGVGYAIRATGKRAKHHDVTVAVSKLAAGRAALDACRTTAPITTPSPTPTPPPTPTRPTTPTTTTSNRDDVDLHYDDARAPQRIFLDLRAECRMAECATSPDLEWTLQKPDHTDAFADVALESSAAVDTYSFEAAAGQKAFFDVQRRRDV